METFISASPEETERWAEEYAKTLRPGDVVLLEGGMGAGKTAVAAGIARGLGIGCEVTSPTYAYINSYEDRLYHFDCYRVHSARQAYELGFSDYFDLGGICLIEWGENILELLPEGCKRVELIKRGESVREIRF